MSLSLSVLSQSGPPKSVGGGGGRGGRGGSYTTLQLVNIRGGNFFFFFFFFLEPGLKLDKKSIENGLEGQKCSVGGLFWGWLPPP